jgi:predicted NBD/HSP70 family sugar kinase
LGIAAQNSAAAPLSAVPAAVELVEAEGRQLGLDGRSACAVFDPDLVVLGGGIGNNPRLLPVVRDTVRALMPFPPGSRPARWARRRR